MVDVSGVTNYPGLIQNGTSTRSGKSNITVQNINTKITGTTTLANQAGYICQSYFCRGSSGTISNCTNSGIISGNNAGGIAGSFFAYLSAGTNTIEKCSNIGIISGQSAGGIAGLRFAQNANAGSTNTIEKCSNNGNISGKYAGGIAGLRFALRAAGMNTISNCYNNGDISGNYTGGITGSQFAQETTSSSINSITNCTNNGNILGNSSGGISGKYTGFNSSGTNTITNCVNNGDISGNFTGGIAGGAIAYTDASNIRPTVIISNSYSIGIIRNTTDSGGICAGFDGNDLDASNNFIDASYATTATAIIKNCYSLHGNIKAPTQSDKVTFNITNTYEANGSWSSNYALRNLLLKDASNAYVWAYQRVNAIDQTNSSFLLYSLNTPNSYVGEISPRITFTIPSPKTFGVDTSFTLTDLSSNSPADFSYNSSNPAVATISNRKVTITGGGTTEITVRQDACGNYLDGSANQQLVVKAILYRNQFVISKNNYVKIIPRKYGIYINNVTSRRISPALPDGLKFSSITGIISGTPVSTSQSKIYKIWTTQTIDNVVTTYRKIITIEIV
jgi:hypothetical protein